MSNAVIVAGAGTAGAAIAQAAATIFDAVAATLARVDRAALRPTGVTGAVGVVATIDAQGAVAHAPAAVRGLTAATFAHGAHRAVGVLAAVVDAVAGHALVVDADVGPAVDVGVAAADPSKAGATDFAVGVAGAVAVIAALLTDVVDPASRREAVDPSVGAPAASAAGRSAALEAIRVAQALDVENAVAAGAVGAHLVAAITAVAALDAAPARVVAEAPCALPIAGAAAAREVVSANRSVAVAACIVGGIAGFTRASVAAAGDALPAWCAVDRIALPVVLAPLTVDASIAAAADRVAAARVAAFAVDRVADAAAAVARADRRRAATVAIGIAGFAGRRPVTDRRVAAAAIVVGRIAIAAFAGERARGDAELLRAALLVGLTGFALVAPIADRLRVDAPVVVRRVANSAAAASQAFFAVEVARAARVVATTAHARRVERAEGAVAVGIAAVLGGRIASHAGVGHALGGRAAAVAVVETFDTVGALAERGLPGAHGVAALADAAVTRVGGLGAARAVIAGRTGIEVHGLTLEVAAQLIGATARAIAGVARAALAGDALIVVARSGQAFGVVGAGRALEAPRVADRGRAAAGRIVARIAALALTLDALQAVAAFVVVVALAACDLFAVADRRVCRTARIALGVAHLTGVADALVARAGSAGALRVAVALPAATVGADRLGAGFVAHIARARVACVALEAAEVDALALARVAVAVAAAIGADADVVSADRAGFTAPVTAAANAGLLGAAAVAGVLIAGDAALLALLAHAPARRLAFAIAAQLAEATVRFAQALHAGTRVAEGRRAAAFGVGAALAVAARARIGDQPAGRTA